MFAYIKFLLLYNIDRQWRYLAQKKTSGETKEGEKENEVLWKSGNSARSFFVGAKKKIKAAISICKNENKVIDYYWRTKILLIIILL